MGLEGRESERIYIPLIEGDRSRVCTGRSDAHGAWFHYRPRFSNPNFILFLSLYV